MLRTLSPCFRFCSYKQAFDRSVLNPVEYWQSQARELHWANFPTKILDDSNPPFYRWYVDGKINITHSILERNLERNLGKQVAYHIESPVTGKSSQITIQDLHNRVQKLASSLVKDFKVQPGDTIIIYMPMIIQGIISQLACARIGAVHSVVFGGFAAPELAIRIKDCNPKVILCATAGKEPNKVVDYERIVADAIKISKTPDIPVIIFQRQLKKRAHNQPNFFDFAKVQQAGTHQPAIEVDSNHPLYILYTSGTTGTPKGIYRDHGGTAVLLNHALKNVYNLHQGDGLMCSSDIGWVVGHSFITYGPLLRGVRSILFQGKPVGTPNAGILWNLISKHKIKHLYTSPTAVRSIRKEDPEGKLISPQLTKTLQGITMAGERLDVETFKWVQDHLKDKFVNDNYWQTQSGGPMLSNFLGLTKQPFKPGSACKPVPGYNMTIINGQNLQRCKPTQLGLIAMKLPTPPSFMLSLWKKDAAFVEKYFAHIPGYYDTGDSGYMDNDGYFHIMARVDDIINTAGHRLSTGEMEENLMKHPKIAEAVVIGVNDEIKGEVPVGLVTVKKGVEADTKQLEKELVQLIRDQIGPVASFKLCYVVKRLPMTRSGKYLRNVVRKMWNKQTYQVPSTIQDIETVHELQAFFNNLHPETPAQK